MPYCFNELCLRSRGQLRIIWRLANRLRVSQQSTLKLDIDLQGDLILNLIILDEPEHLQGLAALRFTLLLSSTLINGLIVAQNRQANIYIRQITVVHTQIMNSQSKRHLAIHQPHRHVMKKDELLERDIEVPSCDQILLNLCSQYSGLTLSSQSHSDEFIEESLVQNGGQFMVTEDEITIRESLLPVTTDTGNFGDMTQDESDEYIFQPFATSLNLLNAKEREKEDQNLNDRNTIEDIQLQNPPHPLITANSDAVESHMNELSSVNEEYPDGIPMEEIVGSAAQEFEPLDDMIQLEPLDVPQREQRRRKHFIFRDLQQKLPVEKIIINISTASTTQRVKSAVDDIIRLTELRKSIMKKAILCSSGRRTVASNTTNLITRHLVSYQNKDPETNEVIVNQTQSDSMIITKVRHRIQSSDGRITYPTQGHGLLRPYSSDNRWLSESLMLPTITDVTEADILMQQANASSASDQNIQEASYENYQEHGYSGQDITLEIENSNEEVSVSVTFERRCKILINTLKILWKTEEHITFDMICPSENTTRLQAARTFRCLLYMHAEETVTLVQQDVKVGNRNDTSGLLYIYPNDVFSTHLI